MTTIEAARFVQTNGCSLMRSRVPSNRATPTQIETCFNGGLEWDVKPAFTGKRRGWFYMDATTAGMLIAVYSALKPEMQAKFNRIPLDRLIDFGWKHVKLGSR